MTWNLIIEEIQYDRNPKINTIFFFKYSNDWQIIVSITFYYYFIAFIFIIDYESIRIIIQDIVIYLTSEEILLLNFYYRNKFLYVFSIQHLNSSYFHPLNISTFKWKPE